MRHLLIALLLGCLPLSSFAFDFKVRRHLGAEDLPASLSYPGQFESAVYFFDQGGDNFVVFSKVVHEQEMRSDFYASQFRVGAAGEDPEVVWDIKDFSTPLCDIGLVPNSLQVLDLDGDNYLESCFGYYFLCDGLDPTQVKFMLHSRGQKLPLRGSVPIESGPGTPEVRLDPVLQQHPSVFRNFLAREWNEFVDNEVVLYQKWVRFHTDDYMLVEYEYQMASGGLHFELQDHEGMPVNLPEDIREDFRYAQEMELTPDSKAIFFNSTGKTGFFEFFTLGYHPVVQLFESTEAVSSAVWSPNRRKVAFISYNPDAYESGTQIFVLTLDGYRVVQKEKFPVSTYRFAAAVTVVHPPAFRSDTQLEYYEMGEGDGPGPLQVIDLNP